MGRIQKKKDPDKKKAQRQEKMASASVNNGGGAAATGKLVQAPKKAPAGAKAKATPGESGIVQKTIQFLREVKVELKKVTWPSRKQTMGSTVVVIILVVIISLFLGVVDFSLSSLMRAVLP